MLSQAQPLKKGWSPVRNYRVVANVSCQRCRIVGISTWTRDYVLMTNRQLLVSVSRGFIRVGNEPYCSTCLTQAELIRMFPREGVNGVAPTTLDEGQVTAEARCATDVH